MRGSSALLGLLLSLCAVGAAQADAIAIKGSYGDKEGCKYAKTGEPSSADVFFLLSKDSITTAASSCDFNKLVSSSADKIVVNITCQSEDDTGPDVATIEPSGKNAYKITLQDGTVWGPLKRCQ